VPVKEIVKVSFTLEPYDKLLPHVTSGEGYVVWIIGYRLST